MAAEKLKGFDTEEDETPDEESSPDPVLNMEDDEEDDEDEPPKLEPKPSRKEKKASRAWMPAEEKERLIREAAEAKAAAVANANAMQLLQQTLQRLPFGGQQSQQRDPVEQELESIDEERLALEREYASRVNDTKNLISQDEMNQFRKRAVKLERRQTEAITAKQIRGMGIAPQRNEQETIIRNYVATRYPEASQDQRALMFAEGVQKQLMAEGKQQWSTEVIDAAMDAAEKKFRYGKYKNGTPAREPDPVLKDRLQSTPRSANGSPLKGQKQIVMTKEFRQMANAAYPHIKDEKKRWAKWAKDQQED